MVNPLICVIKENPIVEVSSSYLQKCGILLFFFSQKANHGCVFFFRAGRIDPVVLECCKNAHSNGNEKF